MIGLEDRNKWYMDKMVGRQRGFQERKFLEKRKPDKTDKGLIRLVNWLYSWCEEYSRDIGLQEFNWITLQET